MKSFIKRAVALVTAAGCLLFDVTAYAAEGIFNPVYSGKFTFATCCFIDVSENDVVLKNVWYLLPSGESNYVSTSAPDMLIFDKREFFVTYGHPGDIVDLYSGAIIGDTKENAFIDTRRVTLDINIFGVVKSATITYNDREYKSS